MSSSGKDDARPPGATPVRRTRHGCLTCRKRRVRCDLTKPVCAACQRLERECHWQDANSQPTQRAPRRPNATACETCRVRKLKCEGDPRRGSCTRCEASGVLCQWAADSGSGGNNDMHLPPLPVSNGASGSSNPSLYPFTSNAGPSMQPPAVEQRTTTAHSTRSSLSIPHEPSMARAEVDALIDLYFDSVHHFGFLAFINQGRFRRLLDGGKAPRDLTMAMVANVLRFACEPTDKNISRSNSLIEMIVGPLLPRVMQGFGVIQLMTLILACHCEGHRNNFTSSWILTGLCVRMMQLMSLHTLDLNFRSSIEEANLPPLMSYEVLRRVAWAVFYQDSMIDGGRIGFSTCDVDSYRIQLPSNEQSFHNNDNVRTENLHSSPAERNTHALGISAFLIRAADMRRRALYVASRAQHREASVHALQGELNALESEINAFIDSLPHKYHWDNVYLHRKRLPAFLVLHLLRHNLYIILGRGKLITYKLDPMFAELIEPARRQRIAHALPISGIIAEGLRHDAPFDPHVGIQAYVALEILLFEPRRLAANDPSIDPQAEHLVSAIPPLLAVIRELGRRSCTMKNLHVEAVHRLLRCDCLALLTAYDLDTFRSEYQPVGRDEAEFDFRDFRWAKMERLRRGNRPATDNVGDEALLEDHGEGATPTLSAAPSPHYDEHPPLPPQMPPLGPPLGAGALGSVPIPGPGVPLQGMPPAPMPMFEGTAPLAPLAPIDLQPWLTTFDPMAIQQAPPMDLGWLMDGTGGGQTGNPGEFWAQIMQ